MKRETAQHTGGRTTAQYACDFDEPSMRSALESTQERGLTLKVCDGRNWK